MPDPGTTTEWRCPKCGCVYTADVGRCGQLQPYCDGVVQPVAPLDARSVCLTASPVFTTDGMKWTVMLVIGGHVVRQDTWNDRDHGIADAVDAMDNHGVWSRL